MLKGKSAHKSLRTSPRHPDSFGHNYDSDSLGAWKSWHFGLKTIPLILICPLLHASDHDTQNPSYQATPLEPHLHRWGPYWVWTICNKSNSYIFQIITIAKVNSLQLSLNTINSHRTTENSCHWKTRFWNAVNALRIIVLSDLHWFLL